MATLFNTRIADTYQGLLKTIDNEILGAGFTEISDGSGNGTSVFLNTGGDLEATGIVSFGSLKDIGENITIAKFVDATDGLINNDNDTTIPTSAAIIDYVATQITLEDLDFTGDGGSAGSIDLDTQVFNLLGTTNQITTSGSGQTLTIGLPSSVTISGTLTATTFLGDLNGTINTLTTAVTQPLGDNSTKIATTAFVDRVITAQDLDFQGTTGSGSVDLDSQVLIIKGTTNEITTVGGAQTLTIGLPSSITTNLIGNVTGNVTGDLTGNVTGNTTGLHTGNVVGNVTGNVTGDLTGNADTATAWANGRTITLTGEATGVTSSIDGTASVSAALTLTNSAVIGKILTGLQSPAGATILATDSMLLAFGKLQSQINGIAEGLQFQGSWNASTNTPTLTSGVGTQGHYYIVSVAGSTDLDGITDWEVGDWAIYSTTSVWQRLDQTGVQGTGTTGNLTKWATGSTISDSIVSESGTALTVTGSLTTTLATTVSGNLTVGTDSLIVNSVSDAVSMAGILTVASPVINTGISGSAVLDDDTFATANTTTVATTESIKAYIDSNTGSGTAGKIPKFAAGGESLDDSIIDQSSGNVTINTLGTGTSKLQVVGGIRNWNSALTLSSRLETDGLYFSGAQDAYIVSQQALNFYAGNAQKLSISSGGVATFSGNVKLLGILELNDVAQSIDFLQSGAINFDSNNDQTGRVLTIGSNRTGVSGGTTNVTFSEDGNSTFAGNVGIGDPPPTSPNGADKYLSIGGNIQDASIILKDATETWEIYQNNDLSFSYGTTPTTVLTLQRSTGNVGIGTSAGQKLVVGGGTNGRVRIKVTEAVGNFGKFDFSTSDSATSSATMIAEMTANITVISPTLKSDLSFSTNSGDSLTEKMRIQSDGDINISGGGRILSSGGIYLGNNNNTSLLDKYEEGNYNSSIIVYGSSVAGSATYTIRLGSFTRIGNLVYVSIRLGWSAHTGSGGMRISLPFNSESGSNYSYIGCSFRDGLTVPSGHQINASVVPNSNYMNVLEINAGTDNAGLVNLDTSVADISFSGVFRV